MNTVPPSASPCQEDGQFYTLWAVFARCTDATGPADEDAEAFDDVIRRLALKGNFLRGTYDVSSMRSAGDVMLWLHGSRPEALQAAVRDIRRTSLFAGTSLTWSAMGVHRAAEFAKDHLPAYAQGLEPESWVCVYPFVRSYDWYLLPAEERGQLLRDHGSRGRDYPHVLSNTVSAFALGDWEWLLALEAPQLTDLVDLMRHLRETGARRHVREEIPFFTGRRIDTTAVAEVLR